MSSGNKLIYLASPFTCKCDHDDVPGGKGIHERANYNAVLAANAALVRDGVLVYSPIVSSYHITKTIDCSGAYDFWQKLDETIIERCDELWVLKLPGWDTSTGVQAEIAHARKLGKTVRSVTHDGDPQHGCTVYFSGTGFAPVDSPLAEVAQ